MERFHAAAVQGEQRIGKYFTITELLSTIISPFSGYPHVPFHFSVRGIIYRLCAEILIVRYLGAKFILFIFIYLQILLGISLDPLQEW